jgi:hypothetical protein
MSLTETPPRWAALYEAAGGRDAVATALGVPASALYRWSRGKHLPRPRYRAALAALCEAHGVANVLGVEEVPNA